MQLEMLALHNKSAQILANSDDMCIIGRTSTALKEKFASFELAARKMGLEVSENKTTYMTYDAQQTNPMIQEGNYIFNKFKYLGSVITTNNDIDQKTFHCE